MKETSIVIVALTAASVVLLCAGFTYFLILPIAIFDVHSRPNGHGDISFDISPSGNVLVFNAVGSGGRDLYLLDLDDLEVTCVEETEAYETSPSFSPDGNTIVYAAGLLGDRADHIFARPINGDPARRLTHAKANDTSPCFSPDGSLIAFARDKTYNWGGLAGNWNDGGVICLIGSDGTNERQITPDGVFAYNPRFSMDGKSVFFSTAAGLASAPIDGSRTVSEIDAPSNSVHSPDGRLIAYSKGAFAGDVRLYIAKSDGTGVRRQVSPDFACDSPVFTNAGDSIFCFRKEWLCGRRSKSIWEVSTDGRSAYMVADSRLFDAPLAWSPDGVR